MKNPFAAFFARLEERRRQREFAAILAYVQAHPFHSAPLRLPAPAVEPQHEFLTEPMPAVAVRPVLAYRRELLRSHDHDTAMLRAIQSANLQQRKARKP